MTLGRKLVAAAALAAILAAGAALADGEREVRITAKRFEYRPAEVVLTRGQPVVLALTSIDRLHGFTIPEMHLRADVEPGRTTRVRLVPERTGSFVFRCDNFCGDGHEGMAGRIIVVD